MGERKPQSELEVRIIVNPSTGIVALIEPVDEMVRPNSGNIRKGSLRQELPKSSGLFSKTRSSPTSISATHLSLISVGCLKAKQEMILETGSR